MTEQTKEATCQTCPFWAAFKSGQRGHCRAGRPSIVILPDEDHETLLVGAWPETALGWWCGEHPDRAGAIQQGRGALYAIVQAMEWVRDGMCATCGEDITDGHAPDCDLDSALQAARGES